MMNTTFNSLNAPALKIKDTIANTTKAQPKFGILEDSLDTLLLSSKNPVFKTVDAFADYLNQVNAAHQANKLLAENTTVYQDRLKELQENLESAEVELSQWEEFYLDENKNRSEHGVNTMSDEAFEKISTRYKAALSKKEAALTEISAIESGKKQKEAALKNLPDESVGLTLLSDLYQQIMTLEDPITLVQVAAKLHNTNMPIGLDDEIGKAMARKYQALTGQTQIQF